MIFCHKNKIQAYSMSLKLVTARSKVADVMRLHMVLHPARSPQRDTGLVDISVSPP